MKINTYIERYKYLLLSAIIIFSAVLVETNYFNQKFKEKHVVLFESITHAKLEFSNSFKQKILDIADADFESYRNLHFDNRRLLTNQEISFIVYKNNAIIYWSDNHFTIPDSIIQNPHDSPLVFIDNSWYMFNYGENEGVSVFLFSRLKTEYPFENKFIKNRFHQDFGINPRIQIVPEESEDHFNVYLPDNRFLLGLTKLHGRTDNVAQRYFAIFLYFTGIIFLLIFMHRFLTKIKKRFVRDSINFLFLFILFFIRLWMIHNNVPYVCYTTELFKSSNYAASFFVPSLGDLFIHILIFLYFVYQLQLRIRDWRPQTRLWNYASLGLFSVLSTALFTIIIKTYESVVYDSTINLELFKLLDSSFLTFVALAVIGIMMYAYFLFLFSGYFAFRNKMTIRKSFAVLLFISSSSILIYATGIISHVWYFILFQIIAHSLFIIKEYREHPFFSRGFRFLLLFVVTVFSQLYLNYHIQNKNQNISRIIAINVMNEQDPVAEMLLQEVKENMRADNELRNLLQYPIDAEKDIHRYLQQKYFSGFLNRYNLESTVCGTADFFSASNQFDNCERYFSDILTQYGIRLLNNDYYFMNNQNGSISYFDSLHFVWADNSVTTLYIELNSKRITQELGYPELLLDKNIRTSDNIEVPYAKYIDGKLVSQNGNYPYSLELQIVPSNMYMHFEENNHIHTVYKANDRTTILVSYKKPSYFNHLVSFSYLFIFFFILLLTYEVGHTRSFKHILEKQTFTDKIKLSLFSVVFASLFLTGVSLVILNIHQYSLAQQKNVKEKMQSIIIELDDYIKDETRITEDLHDVLFSALVRFSNIYFTDINLYSPEGKLLVSSRPEIFNFQLTGTKIHPQAFHNLAIQKIPEFIHKESIGKLRYTSAYAIITNNSNEIIGYLNLPFFTKQAELTQQISSLIVAILNIFVILIMLSAVLAAFLSNKITYPLQILRDKMKLVKVGDGNEKISWQTSDEIGDLIQNYNAMIDQLESSAQKLAESEREGAWHEMAKQIAHEIKNPLTPIKLNIQLLHKAWQKKDPEFEQRLKHISNSIIEQIEALAETANSFSNFAKISEGKPEEINIVNLLENTITLFSQEQNIEIISRFSSDTLILFADKEKVLRVCNNIIKNAIQAIPKHYSGIITVSAEKTVDNQLLITVTDNGRGIAEENKHKLFEPNFTTKTTGSGLGLSICKKIIEQMNGKIWFTSELGNGTSFYIQVPLKE